VSDSAIALSRALRAVDARSLAWHDNALPRSLAIATVDTFLLLMSPQTVSHESYRVSSHPQSYHRKDNSSHPALDPPPGFPLVNLWPDPIVMGMLGLVFWMWRCTNRARENVLLPSDFRAWLVWARRRRYGCSRPRRWVQLSGHLVENGG
jgi:hypothetical protein